ncbi:PAS domain-containing sensor histidine kinase [Mucilaginibacter sp. PAMB04168]|uniref:PAS domain-containing sensor histidine kinase n=1 Tax=Mucilaginibacter sp. PAMB04168 TaxID=3138567 RepID=UPI0031F694CE
MSLPEFNAQVAELEKLRQEVARLKEEKERLALETAVHKAILETNADTLLSGLEQFKLIADNVPAQVWTADAEGSVDYYNKRYFEYSGLTSEESIGWGWQPMLHPDDLQRTIENWTRSVKKGAPYEIQYRFKRASDGAFRWHLGKAIPLKDSNGKVIKWFGTNMDIHEQKVAEKQKDEFLSIASHELKTPLTSVKAFLQLGQKMIAPDTKAYSFVSKASSQLIRLESLISDLLDVSKINAGKMVYNLEPFEFGAALREAVESVQQANEKHQIIIEHNDDVVYDGDRLRIEQVINNFLVNAIKYSPDADKIVVRSEVQQNNIVVSVQDFGIGIAAENLTRLFDRYYRVDNTSMRFQGLGLGLFISSEIIKRHNGSFWIESEPGKGSTFFFLLPISGKHELIDLETDNQTFYKGNFIEMKYVPEQQWLDVNWLGYQNLESVQKGCMIMLDLLQKNNCSKVLNDNTHVVGNWSEAADWGGEYWFPAMQDAGLKHFAWIYSLSTFSRMSAHKSIDITMGKVTAQFFTEIEEARRWLSEAD